MSKQKDMLAGYGEDLTREVTKKRVAPEAPKTRDQAEREKRERLISRGAVTRWRLHPDIAIAVKKAAEREEVTQRVLVEYVLTAALHGLATGKLKLPKRETGSIYTIDAQPIPDEFL